MDPQSPTQSNNPPLISNISWLHLFVVGAVLLLIGLGVGYYIGSRTIIIDSIPKVEIPQNGCTLDAKLCPNGGSVGRIPPSCEFAPCPEATKTPQITDAVTSYAVPANWMKYNNKFQDLQFSFSYPPGLTIYDQDPDSGDIEIRDSKVSVQLLIGRTSLLGFQEYNGGSRREWFLREYKKMFPSEDTGGLSFKEVVFGNNDFLLIQNTRENAVIQAGSDFYLGVFAGKAVRVRDFRTLSKEDVRILLSNLEIK